MHQAALFMGTGSGVETFALVALIMALSVVQGLFGVGLLVFGTPTLLLLGYPFHQALAYLLPSSVLISALQVVQGRARIQLHRSFLWALPPLFVGLVLVLNGTISVDIKLLVGFLMVLSVAVRMSDRLKERINAQLTRGAREYMAVMGLVHGVSNMGGALLTILAASLFKTKDEIRANIACCYLVFGLCQLAVLAVCHPQAFTVKSLMLPAFALASYTTLVQLIYLRTSDRKYQALITMLMLCYGLVLLGQRLI